MFPTKIQMPIFISVLLLGLSCNNNDPVSSSDDGGDEGGGEWD